MMQVLYVNFNKQESLQKEPYATFLKKYEAIEKNPHGEKIELRVGGRDGSFSDGFYVDRAYCTSPRLTLEFAKIPSAEQESGAQVFIRACFSYEGDEEYGTDFHLQRVRDIKKRAPYYYVPEATHFAFSSQIDDGFSLTFDAMTDSFKVSQVCCSLISLIISIFSLDN